MTLPLNSRLSALYDTNGTQKDFGFGFRVFFDPDNGGYGLEVRRQTADGYEVIPKSDYLVLPVEDNSAGVVRFNVAPSAGQQIYIAGKTPTIQQLVLTNFGRYSAESIETQFDFITAIIQEWLSALGEETRQRIAADGILTQYVIQRIDDFVQQVNQNFDDKSQEIEDYINTIMPSFTQTLREEIEAFAVAGMQDAINQTLAESKAEIDDAVALANAAALAAAITGKVYDTPGAGVDPATGVQNGEYYNVRSTDDDSFLVEYQNIGGVPTPSGKSYPSSVAVRNIAKYTSLPFKQGKSYTLHERVQLNNGDIVKSTIDGNTNDPNSDMTGWVFVDNFETIATKNDLLGVSPQLNKIVYVLSEASIYGWSGSEWVFKEKIVTPDMFVSDSVDDLTGFNLACVFANQNNLPVTLLPRTYNIAGQINLAAAGYGLQSLSDSIFSQTVLKASANADNLDTFCLFGNVDRRKLSMMCVDANGIFDIALDTTYSLQVGPSLNLTFQNIIVRGYRKIGWVSENNSDTYFDKCCIFEPKNAVSSGLISMKCITIGGPAQFTNCNFLNGKLQVSAQHIETNQCVIRGIEFMGGSWNVYNAIGTHHFPDETTNSLFIFTGEVWGFSVIGGLCEANNGGYLLNGNGGNLVTSKLSFIQSRVSPDVGALNLQTGTINATFGATLVSIDGGFCGLSSINPSGFVDEVELINVNYIGTAITKKYTIDLDGATKVDTPTLEQVYFSRSLPKNLKSTKYEEYKNGAGGYYGIVNFLSGKAASGSLEIMDASGVHYAKFDYTSIYNLSGVLLKTLTSRVNVTGGSQSIYAYIDAGEIQLTLTNESNTPNPNPLLVKFSGIITD